MSNTPLIVSETKDADEIKKVLCHPEIYSCINDDGCMGIDEFEPPINDNIQYVAGYVDGDIIGLMIYHKVTDKLKCHIQVLPEYRKRYAEKFARMVLDFGEAKNAIIYAEIPACFTNVLEFAKGFGFKETGKINNDRVRKGKTYDVIELRLENGVC